MTECLFSGGQSLWPNAMKAMNWLNSKGMSIDDLMYKQTGDCKSTLFWYDNWTRNGKFKDHYPRLFALDQCNLAMVANIMGEG